ncbi:flavoprotein [Thalassobacillus sp. B23F22_16]|uniref:flavoprotein n=1 Tax=Thalassobacillus sp. B23F22_16 TaxID=3459513 RepID=UPI00373E4174
MENSSFSKFLDSYLDVWKSSSLTDMKDIISKEYRAREISNNEIVDFGYEEAIAGWEQGFNFARLEGNEWDLNEVSIIPLREDEVMAILSATLIIDGNQLENVSLFFQTFKRNEANEWKLIRSYIEAGVPNVNIKEIQFN